MPKRTSLNAVNINEIVNRLQTEPAEVFMIVKWNPTSWSAQILNRDGTPNVDIAVNETVALYTDRKKYLAAIKRLDKDILKDFSKRTYGYFQYIGLQFQGVSWQLLNENSIFSGGAERIQKAAAIKKDKIKALKAKIREIQDANVDDLLSELEEEGLEVELP